MLRTLASFASLLALTAPLLVTACAVSPEPAVDSVDEGALGISGKIVVRGLEHPAGLVVTDKHVYFSANHFVASGDPELDQEFAYWEGKFSRVPLAGGAREKIEESPISRVRMSGKTLFMSTGDSCWISALDTAAAHPVSKSIYTDEDCTGEGGREPTFEVTDTKFIVIRESGEVRVGNLDGSDMKKVAEFRFGDYAGFIRAHAVADGKIFAVTYRNFTDANNKVMPQTLFSVPISGGTPKKVKEFGADEHDVDNLVSDGKNLFFTQADKLFVLPAGSSDPKQLDEGFGAVTDLVVSGTSAYVADSKRDVIYVVKDVLTTPTPHKKLGDAKGITSLAVANGKLYYGTHLITGRKAAGVIGALDLP